MGDRSFEGGDLPKELRGSQIKPRNIKDPGMLNLPVLMALAKHPMTAHELSRFLLISRRQVYNRLNQLAKQNLVVKRFDKRWVPIVTIKLEQPAEQFQEPDAPKPETSRVPTIDAPKPEPKKYKQHIPPGTSPEATRLAKHFNIPALISNHECAMGKVKKCDLCKERTTPLNYGGVPICPLCARKAPEPERARRIWNE